MFAGSRLLLPVSTNFITLLLFFNKYVEVLFFFHKRNNPKQYNFKIKSSTWQRKLLYSKKHTVVCSFTDKSIQIYTSATFQRQMREEILFCIPHITHGDLFSLCLHNTHTHTPRAPCAADWLTAARVHHESDSQPCAGWDCVWQVTDMQENLYISPQPNNQWRDKKRPGCFKRHYRCNEESAEMRTESHRSSSSAIASFIAQGLFWGKMSVRETFESHDVAPLKHLIFKQTCCRLVYNSVYVDYRLQN